MLDSVVLFWVSRLGDVVGWGEGFPFLSPSVFSTTLKRKKKDEKIVCFKNCIPLLSLYTCTMRFKKASSSGSAKKTVKNKQYIQYKHMT